MGPTKRKKKKKKILLTSRLSFLLLYTVKCKMFKNMWWRKFASKLANYTKSELRWYSLSALLSVYFATRNAVLLTAPGRGTPGVRAKVAAYRDKPERCVLRETQVAEEGCARVDGVRRAAVILECKLTSLLLLFTSPRSSIGLSCFFRSPRADFFSNACFISLAWLPILVWRAKKEQDVELLKCFHCTTFRPINRAQRHIKC